MNDPGGGRPRQEAQAQYPSPITTINGTEHAMTPDDGPEQLHHRDATVMDFALELAKSADSHGYESGGTTSKHQIESVSNRHDPLTTSDGADLDDALLAHMTSSQGRQSDALVSSDPTFGESDPLREVDRIDTSDRPRVD